MAGEHFDPISWQTSTAHLKNSLDSKARLIEFSTANDVRGVKMASFEVTGLFNSMPLEPTLDFIGRNIDEGQIRIPIPKAHFLELT